MVMRLRKLFESFRWNPLVKGNSANRIESDGNAVDTEDVHTTEIINLEELVNEKTKDLEEARQQLRQLSGTSDSPAEGKGEGQVREAPPPPLKPESELPVRTLEITPEGKKATLIKDTPVPASPPEAELVLQTMKVSTEVKEELQVSSTSAEPTLPASRLPDGVKVQGGMTTIAATEERKTKTEEAGEVKPSVTVIKTGEAAEKKSKSEGAGDMIAKIFNREDEQTNPLAGLMASLPDVTAKELLDETREIEAMLEQWQQN